MPRKKSSSGKGGRNSGASAPGAVAVTPGDTNNATGDDTIYDAKQRGGKRRSDSRSAGGGNSNTVYDEKQRVSGARNSATSKKKHNNKGGMEEVGSTPMPGTGNHKSAKGVAGGQRSSNIEQVGSMDGSMTDSIGPGAASGDGSSGGILNASTTSADAGIARAPYYERQRRAGDSELHLVHATTVEERDDDDYERQREQQQLPVTYASETVDVQQQEKEQQQKQRRLVIIFAVALVVVVGAVVAIIFGLGLVGGSSGTEAPTAAPTFAGEDGLEQFLSSQSLDGGAAMRNSSSPQGQALTWLLDPTSNPSVGENTDTLTRYVLATMFFALDGANTWVNTDEWLTSTSICEWYTSGSDPCNEEGILTDIDLKRNGLEGELPADEIAMLAPHLKVLDVSGNNLQGTIPTTLGLLTNLNILFIDGNQYEGTIPSELGDLESMEKIYLNDNDLVGSIPDELCALEIKIFWADCTEYDDECICCTRCCVDGTSCSTTT